MKGSICPTTQDALLMVHDTLASFGEIQCRLLVPVPRLVTSLESTVNRLRSETKASIDFTKMKPTDPTDSCEMEFDNFVVISGDPEAVRRALYAISYIIYDFPTREVINISDALLDPDQGKWITTPSPP